MGGFGRVIGAVVGGIIGFFTPIGFSIGFAIGGIIGGLIDPSGGAKSPGVPRQQLSITTNEIGTTIPDVLGTAKVTGIFLCYGKERSKKQYAKSGGKGGMMGGGSKKQVTGYKYYMSWVQAICSGPVDMLYAIYKDNDTLIWEGELACPVSGGKETITIKGLGRLDFYFGTTDHAVNTKIGTLIGDATLNSPLRGLCYAFFDDCLIGTYNRCPSIHFVVRKTPVISSLPAKVIVQSYDYNPANAFWYILHTLSGLPETWLHTADFCAVALTLAREGRGISILFEQQTTALSYLQTINAHIDGIIQYNADGKFHPKLMRYDYTPASLPLVDEDVFLEDPTLSRPSWIDTINEVKVQYSEITNVSRLPVEGSLFVWGDDSAYQLGLGFDVPKTDGVPHDFLVPTQVVGSEEWSALSTGYDQCFTLLDGVAYGIGIVPGTVGTPNPYYAFTPETVASIAQISGTTFNNCKDSSTGATCSGVIKADGTLWMRGQNSVGQLGQGDDAAHVGWVRVGTNDDWAQISCGYAHCAAITNDGFLYVWGDCRLAGGPYNLPTPIMGQWVKVTCSYYYTIALNSAGSLYSLGADCGGQLATGAAGSSTSFVAAGLGNIWADVSSPLLLTVAIDYLGNLYAWGKLWGASDPACYAATLLGDGFVKCAAGLYCAFAIKDDGTLWAIGYNYNGALGLGDQVTRTELVQVGEEEDWIDIVGYQGFTYGIRGMVA